MDWDCLMYYTNDNAEIGKVLLGIFKEELDVQLVHSQNSLDSGSYGEIRDVVHRLKSNLKMFGYEDELDFSENLENQLRSGSEDQNAIESWILQMKGVQADVDDYLKKM